jgi:(4S)-4-hydroxy-5-phosphonooxypentane-2,3-dione isomerase
VLVNIVTVYVKTEHVADFIAATLRNHEASRREPGNRRFDVLVSEEDPARFVLYEVFDSKAAVEEHRRAAHTLEWKTAVEPWFAKPRETVWHTVVAPLDRAAW